MRREQLVDIKRRKKSNKIEWLVGRRKHQKNGKRGNIKCITAKEQNGRA